MYDEDSDRLLPRRRIRRRKRSMPRPTIVTGVNDGTQGGVLTKRTHPFQGSTNPVGLVCMRCNLDVQFMRRCIHPPPPNDECAQSFISTFVCEIPETATIEKTPSVTEFRRWVRGRIPDTDSPNTSSFLAIAMAQLETYAELQTPIPFPIITSASAYPEAPLIQLATFQGCTRPDSRKICVRPYPEKRHQ